MPYKTLLLHVDPYPRCIARTRLAATLAQAEAAHLVGAAMTGISREAVRLNQEPVDPVLAHRTDQLRHRAREALAAFESAIATVAVDSFESRLVDDEAAAGMALQARYADLVVIGQFDPDSSVPGVLANFPETVISDSPAPVLVIPYAGDFSASFRRPVVAWDGSMPACRAVRSALPLLVSAGSAEILMFNPEDAYGVHGDEPGADLALYLARHGISVNVTERRINGAVGEALLSTASDLDADLLVMGAYGHTRFREAMLGGATRTMLQSMTVPVLMAH